jgi:hypothetical protein
MFEVGFDLDRLGKVERLLMMKDLGAGLMRLGKFGCKQKKIPIMQMDSLILKY